MGRPLMSPDGCRIRGTLESLPGVAHCGAITRKADGTLAFEYEGGTEVWWEDAKTVERADENGVNQTVFVDEDGEEWLASELIETPEEEDDG